MNSQNSATSTISSSTTALTIAMRWPRNCTPISRHCEAEAGRSPPAPAAGKPGSSGCCWRSGPGWLPGWLVVIADPRVEPDQQQVGEQRAHQHEDALEHDQRAGEIHVLGLQRLDQDRP